MEKRLLLFLFAMLTTVSTWANFEVDGIYYQCSYDEAENTVYVTYYEEDKDISPYYEGDVVIPSSVTFEGTTYRVTSIGYRAFYGCSSLTSVVIPSSVTEIGSDAFKGCGSLTSVVIPSSVTKIGGFAFSNVTRIDYTGSLEEWCNKQWDHTCISYSYDLYINGNKVEGELVIPSSVTSIGERAFYGCSGLTSVTIPSSVTEIGEMAFFSCSGLTSVVIPSGVTEIGGSAFYDCRGLTSVEIPSSVTSIGSYAFEDCSGLTSVTIPSSVTSIGEKAFYG